MKRSLFSIMLLCAWLAGYAQESAKSDYVSDQITRQKVIDNGGTGNYRAVIVSEKTLPDFTVYRPRNVKAAARREGLLPLLIWCNGACSDNSKGYERMLNEMASHGYLVVAIGKMKVNDDDREDGGSNEKQVVEAINWVVKQVGTKTSDYYKAIDVNNVAAAGHSCGGAQAIANCANTRMKTLLIMNAGMGGMSMGGASPQTLKQLHCPLIYMTGGSGDVAYENAKTDFGSITKVPVVWADLPTAGHGGTYWDPQGGEFGRVALKWMDWHLKGYSQNANIFLKPSVTKVFTKWKIQNKNFGKVDYDHIYDTPLTVGDPVFDRQAAEETFAFGADISFVPQMEGWGTKWLDKNGRQKDILQILKEQGINSVRLRVWTVGSGASSKAEVVGMCKRAKAKGMSVMIDFHYSDTWADPGSQTIPSAWTDHSVEALAQHVYDHTKDVLSAIKAAGVVPKWVQVGNETKRGMLYPVGQTNKGGSVAFAKFVQAGYDAVKAVDSTMQVIVHLPDGHDNSLYRGIFDGLKKNGAKWDIIGLSAYPRWSHLD